MNSGAGSRAFKDSRMLSIHDGQCRFDMNNVVVTTAGYGSCNLPVKILGLVESILIGGLVRCVMHNISIVAPSLFVLEEDGRG